MVHWCMSPLRHCLSLPYPYALYAATDRDTAMGECDLKWHALLGSPIRNERGEENVGTLRSHFGKISGYDIISVPVWQAGGLSSTLIENYDSFRAPNEDNGLAIRHPTPNDQKGRYRIGIGNMADPTSQKVLVWASVFNITLLCSS